MSRFYITTPLYYVNDKPHIGHAYTTVATDAIARWHRLKGNDVFMLTGTDEHGEKVFLAAGRRGVTPRQHVDDLCQPFQQLWERLDITHRDFIRTTETRHVTVVQAVLQKLQEAGDIYADDYEGWYSTSAERFWTEKDLVDGKCPDSGQPVRWIKEKNYFFRMGKYADQLRQWIEDHPDFLQPESRKREVLGYLRKEVGDLCISRPVARLSWGIPLPFDDGYVTYVWFDALLNYITALGYHPDPTQQKPDFNTYWPADFQVVGKDILTTHAVYWSTMLFALGLEPARSLYAHGWWTVEGQKMGKSLGNVVDPNLLIDAYGADSIRYHLLREIPFGGDGDFSHRGVMVRYNADLANDLGNLAHRALTMTEKWLGGRIPALGADTEADLELSALAAGTADRFCQEIEALQFHKALATLWALVGAGNRYIDTQEPWRLNREGAMERLGAVMRRTLEICRVAAIFLSPVCPNKAQELADKLGMDHLRLDGADRLDGLTEGREVAAGEPLFPRLQQLPAEVQAVLEKALGSAEPAKAAAKSKRKKKNKPKEPISFEDFSRMELKAGRIVEAKPHPDADRLLVVLVDVGEETPRQVVAGIAGRFQPDELVGRTVVVVTNLFPATLRGVESQGMILAAGSNSIEGLATVEEDVQPGTIVK